ncbi:MAG: S-adenosylmethionine:tRNA ribosyltransferase-isomerase [Muribaculum sp.]|nr:S-adenosylmethionine:tRNA ribosyltransferase-isomerase [Muribaculum sp.]
MNTNVADIRIEDYDYPLPDERIAKHPLQERDKCKLLVRNPDGELSTRVFDELPGLLPSRSLLIYNNTRVINARLRFRKPGGGATIEIFCLEPVTPVDYAVSFASTDSCSWLCFVGNSKRWKSGGLDMTLDIDGMTVTLTATRESREGNASVINFSWDNSDVTFSQIISAAGEIPIPPYLNRDTEPSDSSDYQTVFSHIDGSVAAPTAGLHFTDAVLRDIDAAGMERRELTLHVGAGTFQPVKSDSIGEHDMHSEFIAVSRDLIMELAATDRPVIAVGTTSVRTLESLYHIGCLVSSGKWNGEVPQWYPYSADHPHLSRGEALSALTAWLDSTGSKTLLASTRIIIAPGYDFKIVNGIVTNFHQPKSTLLLLVSAFIGGDWRPMYDFALDGDYRFLSYGDASLLLR